MSEPLIPFDPVKTLKRLFGIEEAKPQEQQAEVPKPEPEKPQTTIQPISPVETMPASQEPTPSPKPTPTPTTQPLPQPEPLPTIQPQPTEAPLQSTPPDTQIKATTSSPEIQTSTGTYISKPTKTGPV